MSTKHRIPGYCFHVGKQLAYVRLNGQMIYLGTRNSPESRTKYDRLIAEWMASGRTYIRPEDRDGLSVNEILLAYSRFAASCYVNPDGTASPELEKIDFALRPLIDLYGETPAKRFGPKSLKAVREKLIDKGLARPTINQRINILRRAFSWAASEELVEPSIDHGLKAVSGLRRGKSAAKETAPIKPVPESVVDATLKYLPPTLQTMTTLQNLTGMRSGEMVIMRTCDIEITADGKPWIYRPSKHKTINRGHDRIVAIGPKAQEILRPYLKSDLQAFIFTPHQAQIERNATKSTLRKTKVQPSQISRKKRHPTIQPGMRYPNLQGTGQQAQKPAMETGGGQQIYAGGKTTRKYL